MHPLTRRRLLLGVVGLPSLAALTAATAGCTSDPPAPEIDPNRTALEGALVIERTLFDVVTAWDGAESAQLALSAVVTAHIEALQSALADTSASPATPSTPTAATPTATEDAAPAGATTTDSVRRAADDAADQHTRALRAASAVITPLLASLAASDAAMAASLRGAGRGVSP